MIGLLRAFAWLRWRLLVNGMKGAKRRDAMERLSRIVALITPVILFVLFLVSTTGLSALAMAGGWLAGKGTPEPGVVPLVARGLLLALLLVLILVPVGRATHGKGANYARLLLLPIPRRALHLIELVVGLADPWVAVVIPPLVCFAVGLALVGRTATALMALAAGLAFAAVAVCLASLTSFLMEWLMRSRRRGEFFTLFFVLVLSFAGLVPALIVQETERRKQAAPVPVERARARSVEAFDRALPWWTRALPSELYGRSVHAGLEGRAVAWLGVGALLLETGALYGLSSLVHRKLTESAESGTSRRRAARARAGLRLLPFVSPATSAVALAQFRSALRSVRGRLAALLPGPIVAVLGFISTRVPEEFPGGDFLGSHGWVLLSGGILFSLYALQAFFMNQFACDRAGLTLQFLSPLSDRSLVRGKALGGGLILAVPVLLCSVVALVLAPGGHPFAWIAVLLSGAATYALLTPAAALLSALFPAVADLSKTGSGGNPHSVAFITGTFLVMLCAGPPALILGVVYHVLGRPGLALVLVALWTALATALAIPLLGLASRAVAARRENLALVAQGR